MDNTKTNETLQDFVLQGFCTSGLTLDSVVDFEPIDKRGVVGIAPLVVSAPSIVSVPFSIGRLEHDFVLAEPRSGSLNLAADAVDFTFASDVPARGDDLTVFAAGFDASLYGQPDVWNFDTPVSVPSVLPIAWGQAELFNRNQVALPRGFDALNVSHTKIWNVSQSFSPIGLEATQWGSLNVSPQFVYPHGWESSTFGRSVLFNANQWVMAIGLDATGFGNTRLIALRQRVFAKGFDAGNMGQQGRVSERVRDVLPIGFDAAEFGTATMGGGVRTIAPPSLPFMVGYTRQFGNSNGWADGEANIPVSKLANERYSVWSFGWLGMATIQNRNQRVSIDGVDELAMGAAYVAEPVQTIETHGFDATEWGYVYRWSNEKLPRTWDNPVWISWHKDYWDNKADWTHGLTVLNGKRPLWAQGGDVLASGTPLIAYAERTIAPYGFDAASMRQYIYNGEGYLVSRTEYYAIGAGDLTAFGWTSVVNTRLKQIAPKGLNTEQFGRGNVSLRKLGALGLDATQFGQANIGGGLFQGFEATEWGITWVSDAVRSISGSLNDVAAFGVPSLRDTRLQVSSVLEAGVFGDIRVVNRNRTISAKSVEFTERVSDWASVRLTNRWLTLSGFETFAMGKPNVQLWIRTIQAQSVGKTDVFAIGMVADRVRTLHAGAFVATEFGVSTWQREPILPPKGFSATEWGQPEIHNRNHYVRTGNFEFTQMGGASVDYFSRWLKTEGIDATQWGNAWVSHDRRVLSMSGWDKAAVGNTWVSFGVRTIEPTGFLAQDFRQPEIGGTQTIAPESWDSAAWGNRIVPERLLLDSVQGFDTAIWGKTRIFNRLQVVAPNGFEWTDKFGHTTIWLKRQYIQQIHDAFGGLAPPVWNGWTSVVNRNQTVSAFGIVPPRVAEPTIHNAARVVSLEGVEMLDFGRLMTAFRVRTYRLDGIEPVRISDWHSVHNAARVLSPFAIAPDGLMQPEIRNTRRAYRWITAGDTAEFGTAMIADAVRTLAPYQGIAPEYLPLPTVFNSQQYVQAKGFDAFKLGVADAAIHWNIIAPKTHFQAAFGWVDVRNVTPELHFTGKDMAAFGQPEIGLWTRYIRQPESLNDSVVGTPVIADRRKTLLPAGWLSLRFGQANVWHLTTPVNYSRVIYPESIFRLLDEFGVPDLHKNTLEVSGIVSMKFGKPSAWSNGVHVDFGIGTDGVGEPSLTLRRRVVDLHNKGIFGQQGLGKPVVSPITIWCRSDAPSQAQNNHKGAWHAIDASIWEKLGTPKLTQRGKQSIQAYGIDTARVGVASVQNWKRYVSLHGWHNGRIGWAIVGDGTQTIEAFNGADTAVMGSHQIGFVPSIHRRVSVYGIDGLEVGKAWAALWRQNVFVQGMASMAFGSSRESSNAFMPQTLAVYFPKPVQPKSWNSAVFGQTQIGLLTRTVSLEGWDNLLLEYDLMNFKARMRVGRGGKTIVARTIGAHGFNGLDMGIADVSHKVRYIRPDGFMDNFRKGVANV